MARQDQIKLPGFGLPLDESSDDPYGSAECLSAVIDWRHDVFTVREKCMLFFVNKITDKPDWQRKVQDPAIIAKWKQEVNDLDWTTVVDKNGDMSTKMFEYCIKELCAKAALYEETGLISVLDAASRVLKSDTVVSAELKDRLKKAVVPLEDVPEHQKDWHPGSDGKVLDLVHPSLFPLIYQCSRILPDRTISQSDCMSAIGRGKIVPEPVDRYDHDSEDSNLWSSRFQWLPCDVSFPDGEKAKIDSYINNLHPADHKDLYAVIEDIITIAIPFWNIIWESYPGGSFESKQRIECDSVEYKLPEGTKEELPDDFDGYEEDFYETLEKLRIYDKPEPLEFDSLDVTAEDVENKFKFLSQGEKKIQVIVKLANIHLTPEKPSYEGGSWHVEGQLNEHIVATALYYYDNENITDSHLSFRTKVDSEELEESLSYEQGDYKGIEKTFGIINYTPNTQEIGAVLTREDRFIAFPNGFQHRVGSFKLIDPTKPGHRKILALFLVAPTIPVISTANVPPQQRDWWLREIKADKSKVSFLPAELIDMIADGVDFPIGLAEAKALREELMAERGMMDKAAMEQLTDREFSFCEH
ncbi:uncharacterized protein K460DRAFT_406097 [Cucurbitaria berberidis CBS 394.84]|uniref:Uncharacterized protein n=1 Tax=Cucurbitaria berberidis CBS 394.84 TaxID=1168544 RepID=A0A9P4GI30_9PLEO|nr:uncharacterized protein K460DRAFT_406097 [Cucurbitaria berberidis CBS 394.84]KAF1845864.1 hypothetical protein K460DRAFT_406097 [Cucurbitaria berberidis CBS 394.84]